jgi:chloramphenicol-sensitive protein RarD
MSNPLKGTFYALGAYLLWGILPIYWKALLAVPAGQILCHRICWSCLFLFLFLLARREWTEFRSSLRDAKIVRGYVIAALLLSVNWFTYIWSVNHGQIVETSLGYFINPLVSVVLALHVLKERLRPIQWLAIGLAAAGVLWLTWQQHRVPWIALVLAFSFGFYGLLKKKAPLGALHGLTLETATLALPAVLVLIYAGATRASTEPALNWTTVMLLAGGGLVTAMPLFLFARAAQMIKLSTLGLLQYISPTCGLLLGTLLYQEPFPTPRLIGFAIIWVALFIYWVDLALSLRQPEPLLD